VVKFVIDIDAIIDYYIFDAQYIDTSNLQMLIHFITVYYIKTYKYSAYSY